MQWIFIIDLSVHEYSELCGDLINYCIAVCIETDDNNIAFVPFPVLFLNIYL